jgi:hypothetical protein
LLITGHFRGDTSRLRSDISIIDIRGGEVAARISMWDSVVVAHHLGIADGVLPRGWRIFLSCLLLVGMDGRDVRGRVGVRSVRGAGLLAMSNEVL